MSDSFITPTPLPTTALQAVIEIEADVRLLEGIVSVLRYLGERNGTIEAGAIAALAVSAHEPVTRLIELRRSISRGREIAPGGVIGNSSTLPGDAAHA